ncbi:hypothetical protein GF402_11145 [Candidatus Fermentibacteria bacterium]|nr:hypothetical protein [Candidatus Fermentibacteria bacterium]
MRGRLSALALLLCFAPALAAPVGLAGHWKSYALYTLLPNDSLCEAGSWQGILRLESGIRISRTLRLEGAYVLLPTVRDGRLWGDSGRTGLRVSDPDLYLHPEHVDSATSFAVLSNIDRLNATLRLSFADVIAGRQAVSWGTAHFVSPSDFLAPYPFNQLESENRQGVDALRARVPLGLFSELDLGVVSGYHAAPDSSAIYARLHNYVARSDIDLIVGVHRRDIVLGCNASRAAGGASVWFDGTCTFLGGMSRRAGETMLRASLGADYRLAADLYGQIEYHYSSHRARELGQGPNVYLNGSQYLIHGLSWQASPLLTVTPSGFVNLEEPSAYGMLSVDYSIAQNVFLGVGSQLSFGSDSEDLGSYADVYYVTTSYYF